MIVIGTYSITPAESEGDKDDKEEKKTPTEAMCR